ncbi:MAG: phosphoribosyltransferase family protein [Saprospiraceae bacterium]
MVILNSNQIKNKIIRIASEIHERHADSEGLILAGINNKGFFFAESLQKALLKLGQSSVRTAKLSLNPAHPLEPKASIDLDLTKIASKQIIVIDDISNTGRTLFFAMGPFMEVITKKLEVCVMVERMHKSYPICVDYFGVRLATTLKQNIELLFKDGEPVEAQLN